MPSYCSRQFAAGLRYTTSREITTMVIILMGVTAAGKTTVGQALAAELHWEFADADDYHSVGNVAKMHAGIPLTDADRDPWLAALHQAISEWLAAGANVVLACSALKATYRQRLAIAPGVKLVYLHATRELIAARLAERRNHYMNPSLIDSQFATLQEPPDAVTVDASQPTEVIVAKIRKALSL
jgi:gluconokinase